MAIKFEVNKWYQFKNKQAQEAFIKDHIENGTYAQRLSMHPFKILDVDSLQSPTKIMTSSGTLFLYEDILSENYICLLADDAQFFDEVEDPNAIVDEVEEPAPVTDTSDFPLMKVTIENNEQAWFLYQMLKAHFKE